MNLFIVGSIRLTLYNVDGLPEDALTSVEYVFSSEKVVSGSSVTNKV
jgi:hypothetical protein